MSLAEYYLKDTDYEAVKRNCFNDRRNPDDDELDTQIVKVEVLICDTTVFLHGYALPLFLLCIALI